MAKSQKYRSSVCAYPFPEAVWSAWSSRLPEGSEQFKRRITYSGLEGDLKPTEVTKSNTIWEYTIPPGRTAVVDNICDLQTMNNSRGMGGAKLNLPSKRAQKKGATAASMSMACGPVWIKMTSPTSKQARQAGRIGKIRCRIWAGQLMFEDPP